MNISIKKEAYDFLKARKGKDESFSDVILSMREEKGSIRSLLKFAGVLKGSKSIIEIEKNIASLRNKDGDRVEEMIQYMEESRR